MMYCYFHGIQELDEGCYPYCFLGECMSQFTANYVICEAGLLIIIANMRLYLKDVSLSICCGY